MGLLVVLMLLLFGGGVRFGGRGRYFRLLLLLLLLLGLRGLVLVLPRRAFSGNFENSYRKRDKGIMDVMAWCWNLEERQNWRRQ